MNDIFPLYSTEVLGQSVRETNGRSIGLHGEYRLTSAFQPIFSLAHKRIVGYEALVRAEDAAGVKISPEVLFKEVVDLSDIIFLDRLCRYIHVANFQAWDDNINWLFLNVSPRTIIHGKTHGSFFGDLLKTFDLSSHRVVIEIVEHPFSEDENDLLLETLAYYRSLGCLIAIDDFGAGHSNFDRIWGLKPDIVKLDRSMILRAADSPHIRQLLPGIVSLLHQAGALVLLEGIETEEQAVIAVESDADMVQGYYFAKPNSELSLISSASPPFETLFEAYKTGERHRGHSFLDTYRRYSSPFAETAALLQSGTPLADASLPLFRDETVIRCYLLEPGGIQIGQTVTSGRYEGKTDPRFRPLEDARSANWFRRPYLRRAIMHPEQLQITRPYLSITGAHMCTTLSMMVPLPAGEVILCCDLKL